MVRAKYGLFDSMRPLYAFATLTAIAALSAAAAQSYSDSVTVNPYGARVLIDPGTGQTRVVPPLLMPGEEAEPIRLRPPKRSRRAPPETPPPAIASAPPPAPKVAAAPPPARTYEPPPPARTYEPPPPAAEPPPVAEPSRVAKAAPPPRTTPAPRAVPAPPPAPQAAPPRKEEDFTDLAAAQPAPPPRRPTAPKATPPVDFDTSLPPRQAAKAEPPVEFDMSMPPPSAKPKEPVFTASLAPQKPVRTHTPFGDALGTISFAPNASDPTTSAVAAVRALAGKLNSALSAGGKRVEIKAYAGERGEKTSDTRRMSLKRALVVRQLLIDDGVPAERIDVSALGGADDDGPTERVDVLLKG